MENSMKTSILTAVSTGQQLSPTQVKQLEVILDESNLPAQAGLFDMHFDHNELNTFAACGVHEESFDNAHSEFKRLILTFEGKTKSEFIETFFAKASTTLCKVILIEALCEKMSPKNPFEDMMRKLKDL